MHIYIYIALNRCMYNGNMSLLFVHIKNVHTELVRSDPDSDGIDARISIIRNALFAGWPPAKSNRFDQQRDSCCLRGTKRIPRKGV